MSALKITLKKSLIGYVYNQSLNARALGLGKVGSSVIQPDTAPIRGMVRRLAHAVTVEAVDMDQIGSKQRSRRKSAKKETV